MKVSVVIPTFRRPALLERCLQAIAVQTLDGSEFEVLVCDDADSGEAAGLIVRMARTFPANLRWLAVSQAGSGRHGPAAARNAGWRHARAPSIAFTDDDTLPSPEWLEEGLKMLQDRNLIAIAGKVVVPLRADATEYERRFAQMEKAEFLSANCFVRKDALQRIGGFDERFTAPWREDSDLHFSLLELAARSVGALRVGRCERSVVVHPVRPLDWSAFLSQQRKALFNALLYKKHPQLYRQRIQALPPVRHYLQVFSAIAALACAFEGHSSFLLASLLVWLALTVDFAARRLRGVSRRASRLIGLVWEVAWTSAIIPFVSVYWRVRGAFRFQVLFF